MLHRGCLDLDQLIVRAGSRQRVVRPSPLALNLNSALRCAGSEAKVARPERSADLLALARLGLMFSLLIREDLHVYGGFLEGGCVGSAIGVAASERVDGLVYGV